jgi:cytochrome c biogenesis protein CcdA/thiol-disulfide isomerase/thioredoxin
MLLPAVAFLGGLLTIVSPCILPVLPLVLTRAGQPFRRSGLPLLAGMALTFAGLAALAAVAGEWLVRANQLGRSVAMAVFAVLGLSLIVPRLADYLSRPLVRLGARGASQGDGTFGQSVVLGVSTGLLWTPCAGPILGLILTGAALEGARWRTLWLLVSFALGAAVALTVVLAAGNRLVGRLKRSFGVEAWIRRGIGTAVLGGVGAIVLGVDTGLLARISLASTSGFEQRLVERVNPAAPNRQIERAFPSLAGAVAWLNSAPLDVPTLRGHVVLIDFWTYSCINCLRAIPHVQAWFEKYRSSGFIVIGVHTPEFAFEKDVSNVEGAVRDLNLAYPVAVDSNYAIWKAFENEYWPAHYVIDAKGNIRYHHFGEGQYEETERVIQQLLREMNAPTDSPDIQVRATGAQAPPNLQDVQSPETYFGYERQEHFASPQPVRKDEPEWYTAPVEPSLNQWGLAGHWRIEDERAQLLSSTGRIVFRFHARDLHLVLGSVVNHHPIRFRVLIDGSPPGPDHGVDVDAEGRGLVTGHRLYQLIRQKGRIVERTFEIEFFGAGLDAFAFTFG